MMTRFLRRIIGAISVVLLLGGACPAWAEPSMQDFRFSSERSSMGVAVHVRYNHGLLGWVDVGRVDFQRGGEVVLAIRGEKPRKVRDLSSALVSFIHSKGQNVRLGKQLAQVITQHGGASVPQP